MHDKAPQEPEKIEIFVSKEAWSHVLNRMLVPGPVTVTVYQTPALSLPLSSPHVPTLSTLANNVVPETSDNAVTSPPGHVPRLMALLQASLLI